MGASQRTAAPEDPLPSPGDTPAPSSAWWGLGRGQRRPPARKQVRYPLSLPGVELGAGRIYFQARGGLPGGFIQGRTKEVEDSILKGIGGVLLDGPEMNHSRAGDTP